MVLQEARWIHFEQPSLEGHFEDVKSMIPVLLKTFVVTPAVNFSTVIGLFVW